MTERWHADGEERAACSEIEKQAGRARAAWCASAKLTALLGAAATAARSGCRRAAKATGLWHAARWALCCSRCWPASWQGADMRPLELCGATPATWRSTPAELLPARLPRVAPLPRRDGRSRCRSRVWGTVLAIVLRRPARPARRRATSSPWWVRQPVRRLMDACRAINEMVFAMLFVVAVGLGPFAGVLALLVHTTGIAGQAVLRGGGGDRPAAGRRHPRHRRERAGRRSSTA